MKKTVYVFVYSKNKQIKVLGLEDSKELNESLISDGWIHTHTLDACTWMEYLYNNSDDAFEVLDNITGLSKIG